MRLTSAEKDILRALAAGCILKAHRDIDGHKFYYLHPHQEGEPQALESGPVQKLVRRRLIDSNKKFPASTFLLTERGRAAAAMLVGGSIAALGAEQFVRE